jgi:hypothetical protein
MSSIQLDRETVANYWRDKDDALGFLQYLLERETWTLDHELRVDAEVTVWANRISTIDETTLFDASKLLSIITVLGYIGADKAFYFLNTLTEKFPTFLNQLLAVANSNLEDPQRGRVCLVFIDRLRVANQHAAINLALGVDRLALVQFAIKQAISKYGSIT